MTEAEADAAHEQYMKIARAITDLVNKMTEGLSPEQDEYIRDVLNDTQRYWRS